MGMMRCFDRASNEPPKRLSCGGFTVFSEEQRKEREPRRVRWTWGSRERKMTTTKREVRRLGGKRIQGVPYIRRVVGRS